MSEHAVIVAFEYGDTDLDSLFELEDQLSDAIENAGVGEFDGNEIAANGTDGTLYMYGPDADKLFEAIKPVLESAVCIENVVATLRYGPPEEGVKERKIEVS